MRQPMPGVKYYKCECGFDWTEETRDALSLSCSDCPVCNAVVACYKLDEVSDEN